VPSSSPLWKFGAATMLMFRRHSKPCFFEPDATDPRVVANTMARWKWCARDNNS
jgi:hypothetical protein